MGVGGRDTIKGHSPPNLMSERQTAQCALLLKGPLRIDGGLMESNGALAHAEALSHFWLPHTAF